MYVVAAGVHHAWAPRRERESSRFGDGKRVDVASYRNHRRRWITSPEARHHAGVGDALECCRPELAERFVQPPRRLTFLERELGMTVDFLAQRHKPALYVRGDEAIGVDHLAVAGARGRRSRIEEEVVVNRPSDVRNGPLALGNVFVRC